MIVDLTNDEWSVIIQCLYGYGKSFHVPEQDRQKMDKIVEKITIVYEQNKPVTISRSDADKIIEWLELHDDPEPEEKKELDYLLKMLKNEN